MTDPTLADIRALHMPAGTDGQKTLSRRTVSAICVVVVHLLLIFFFWLPSIAPKREIDIIPPEVTLLLSPANKDLPVPPQEKKDEIPKGNSRPQNTAPLLIPPPNTQTLQQQQDQELMGGVGAALACMAGQFEYLPEPARLKCQSYLVPWKLDRSEVLARGLKPTDPNAVELHLGAAEATRRTMETYNPCVGATGPSASACGVMHGATP